MHRSLTPLIPLLAAAIVIPSASAIESTINPGVGIGRVKLGMSATQVKRAMGTGFLVNKRRTINGVRYVELGWDFDSWAVTFVQRGKTLRVAQVSTTVRSQKTAKGIGLATSWRKVVAAYPSGHCAFGNPFGPNALSYYLEYLVPHEGGTQTIYTFRAVFSKEQQEPSATS